MRVSHRAVLCLGLLSWGALSCTTNAPDSAEPDAITKGALSAGDSPYYWADVPLATLPEGLAPGSVLIERDDILQAHLQAWVDRFDAIYRATTRNTVAPTPRVVVVQTNATMNAWVMPAWGLLGSPARPTSATAAPLSENARWYFDSKIGFADPLSPNLVAAKNWNDSAAFVSFWNSHYRPSNGCRLSLRDGMFQWDAAQCKTTQLVATSSTAMSGTAPYIFVATDYAQAMVSEHSIATTLAHELGHYYRAHASPLVPDTYNFWFIQDGTVDTRPLPSARANEFAARAATLLRTSRTTDGVAGSGLGIRTREAIMAVLKDTFDNAYTPPARGRRLFMCEGFNAWSDKYDAEKFLIQARAGAPVASATFQEIYMSLERLVLQCAPKLVTGKAGDDALGAAVIPFHVLNRGDTRRDTAFDVMVSAKEGETLAAYLARSNSADRETDVLARAFADELNDNQIGLYTIEQEADEISVELSIAAGLTASEVWSGWLATMRGVEQVYGSEAFDDSATGTAGPDLCGKYLEQGFVDPASKKPIRMTLGDLTVSHHGSCYRLYNLWREAKAHRYDKVVPVANKRPVTATTWEQARKHAEQLTSAAKP